MRCIPRFTPLLQQHNRRECVHGRNHCSHEYGCQSRNRICGDWRERRPIHSGSPFEYDPTASILSTYCHERVHAITSKLNSIVTAVKSLLGTLSSPSSSGVGTVASAGATRDECIGSEEGGEERGYLYSIHSNARCLMLPY
jgi:hypothetical protein